MNDQVEKFVVNLINSGKDTKTIINELIINFEFTRNSANSLIKKIRQSLGIHHRNNQVMVEYDQYDEDDEKFIGGKIHSTKKRRFKD